MACIITFARSWQALVAVRSLGKAGINVITADTDNFATAFFSKYSLENFIYPSPYDEKAFVRCLVAKAREIKRKYGEEVMLLPIHKETYTISKYKKQLSRHMKLCVNSYDRILELHNKASIAKVAKRLGVRHPKTYAVRDIAELYRLVPRMKFPVFMKLPESAASIGLQKIDERDSLIYEFSKAVREYKLKPAQYPVVQESVPGTDYCVTAIYNKGEKRAMMSYMNIKCHPYKSGPGVYRKNVQSPEMERQASRLLNGVKWHGPIELDFRMGRDKKPYLIEANPRFWGGLNQSVASNVDYPRLAYDIAMIGDCRKITKIDKSVRTENLATAVMALFDEIHKDERKQKQLKNLQRHWKNMFRGDFAKNFEMFLRQLGDINRKRYAFRSIEEFIKRRKLVKDDIIDMEDPFVVMGIFYPVNLLLKHGKVDRLMLTGESVK